MVAKIIKIKERRSAASRIVAKDALDVLRLLRGVETVRLSGGLSRLTDHDKAGDATREAIDFMNAEFRLPSGFGSLLAAEAAAPLEAPDEVIQSCAILTESLLRALG